MSALDETITPSCFKPSLARLLARGRDGGVPHSPSSTEYHGPAGTLPQHAVWMIAFENTGPEQGSSVYTRCESFHDSVNYTFSWGNRTTPYNTFRALAGRIKSMLALGVHGKSVPKSGVLHKGLQLLQMGEAATGIPRDVHSATDPSTLSAGLIIVGVFMGVSLMVASAFVRRMSRRQAYAKV